tara:strand:+ start:592 stop:780 length:189 start_codon:yes stop_codon:yes gene_type:complete
MKDQEIQLTNEQLNYISDYIDQELLERWVTSEKFVKIEEDDGSSCTGNLITNAIASYNGGAR